MNLGVISRFVPVNWALAPSGALFAATGVTAMLKWDGMASQYLTVGVTAPTVAPTAAWSGSGAISGSYTAYYRYVDANGNLSNPIQVQTIPTANNNSTITYSGLQLPTNDGTHTPIVRRQLLRNTNGQTTTFYVDIDTTDLSSTSLSSTNTDSQLTANTAIPSANLFTFGTPPSWKAAIANHLGRMFAAAEVVVDQGVAVTTNGSTAVLIVGYPGSVAPFGGRMLYVTGASQGYTLATSTDPSVITLTTPYADPTVPYASYAIRPAPTERRLIYYSQANLPEAWPPSNAISLQEDGDEITGLMPFGSFLYILESHHIYRLTYQTDPGVDGGVFLALNRGCLNQRCWVLVEGTAYLLDDQGIHAYGGARDSEPISSAIQDLFRFSDSDLRVNWAASKWFHAVHFPPQETIRWFVALAGTYLPYHAICYNYRQKRWWIEQWAVPIGASALGRLGKSTRTPQVYLGTSATRIVAMWQGTLDGPDPTQGTVRGTVTSSGLDSFTDSTATFASQHLLGNPVSIVDGRGKGQQQIIQSVTGNMIRVKNPWSIRPDTTSVYQLGGIQWQVQFGWWRTLLYEQLNERYFAMVFQPLTHATLATMRMFVDFSTTPFLWSADRSLFDGNGVRTTANSADVVLDLTKPTGYVQLRFPGHREFFADGVRYLSFQLSGVTNTEPQRIYWVLAGGVEQA